MYHANRMLVDHANRRAEERIARADLLRQASPSIPSPLRRLLARLPRIHADRASGVTLDLETTSG
jgi:hypothetical protein